MGIRHLSVNLDKTDFLEYFDCFRNLRAANEVNSKLRHVVIHTHLTKINQNH